MKNLTHTFTLGLATLLLSACGNWSTLPANLNQLESQNETLRKTDGLSVYSMAADDILILSPVSEYDYEGAVEIEIFNESDKGRVLNISATLPDLALFGEQITAIEIPDYVAVSAKSKIAVTLKIRASGAIPFVPARNFLNVNIAEVAGTKPASTAKLFLVTR